MIAAQSCRSGETMLRPLNPAQGRRALEPAFGNLPLHKPAPLVKRLKSLEADLELKAPAVLTRAVPSLETGETLLDTSESMLYHTKSVLSLYEYPYSCTNHQTSPVRKGCLQPKGRGVAH
jgi:hypothetical protein